MRGNKDFQHSKHVKRILVIQVQQIFGIHQALFTMVFHGVVYVIEIEKLVFNQKQLSILTNINGRPKR